MDGPMDNFGYMMDLPDDPALFGYLLDPLTDSTFAEFLPVDDFFDECASHSKFRPNLHHGHSRTSM